MLTPSWEVLAPSWRSWDHLGSKLEVLGQFWLQVRRSWRHLGSKLRLQSENIEKPLVFQGSGRGRESKQPARGKVKGCFGVAH